jgi:hypothetical protein
VGALAVASLPVSAQRISIERDLPGAGKVHPRPAKRNFATGIGTLNVDALVNAWARIY